jgi:hypothetical protein
MVLLLGHSTATAALAWADRLCAKIAPLPSDNPSYLTDRALEAYRQVNIRFPSSRAIDGYTKCLLLLGRYSAAASVKNSPLATVAFQRLQIAKACARFAPRRSVVQVEPVPRTTDRWVVLFANAKPSHRESDGDWLPPQTSNVGILQIRFRSGHATPLSHRVQRMQGESDDMRAATLYVTDARLGRDPVALVYEGYFIGDSEPNGQEVFRIESNRLRKVGHFYGKAPSKIVAATKASPLHLMVTPTWKVWWPDVYEWNGNGFRFANQRHPELYPSSPSYVGSDDYAYAMIGASELTIQRRYAEAIIAWRQAERACRMSIWYGAETYSHFWDAGYFGGKEENLKEIRRRIWWLRKGELNHPLLYRPYDFDLQVPPYRLGDGGRGNDRPTRSKQQDRIFSSR